MTFEPNKQYVREILASQYDLRTDGMDYVRLDELPDDHRYFRYQEVVNADGTPSEMVIDENRQERDRDYRDETEGEIPIPELQRLVETKAETLDDDIDADRRTPVRRTKPSADGVRRAGTHRVDEELAAPFLADTGLNGAFVADLLSAMVAHERCGVHLYRSSPKRANNPVLKRAVSGVRRPKPSNTSTILEALIGGLGGNPAYVSPMARARSKRWIPTCSSRRSCGRGSHRPDDAESSILDAVFLAETIDHANWETPSRCPPTCPPATYAIAVQGRSRQGRGPRKTSTSSGQRARPARRLVALQADSHFAATVGMKHGGGWGMTEESTKDQAKEQVREVAQSTAEQAGQVRDSVKEQASQVADEVKTQGREVLERTKEQVRQQGEAQTQQVAGSLRTLGEQAQALADGRTEDAGPVVDYVRQASDRLQGMATRLEERGAQGLVQDLEEFGRRRPGAFLAGAALAGFVVGRVVRSASPGGPSTASNVPYVGERA